MTVQASVYLRVCLPTITLPSASCWSRHLPKVFSYRPAPKGRGVRRLGGGCDTVTTGYRSGVSLTPIPTVVTIVTGSNP